MEKIVHANIEVLEGVMIGIIDVAQEELIKRFGLQSLPAMIYIE